MKRRGIHVMVNGRSNLAALERLIGEIAPALGFNWVIAEINRHFQYASHPEAAEADGISAAEAGRLAQLAKEKSINLVPMYNCLGHQSWKEKAVALLRAHPEFNEAPELDATAEDFYCMSWCPNHPDINPLIFHLFDELIDVVKGGSVVDSSNSLFLVY